MRKTSITLVIACAVLTASAAFGGVLNKNIVSGDANWVVHADIESFNQTKLAKIIRAELAAKGIDKQLEFVKTVFSIHPLDDIQSITIYGQGKDKSKAVAVVRASFDRNLIENLVSQNPYFEQIQHGKFTIGSWIDENKIDKGAERQYGAFFSNNIGVIGTSSEAVRKSLDVLDGKAASARKEKLFKGLRKSDDGFIVAAAEGVGKMAQQYERTMMLKHTDQSTLTVGESEGNLVVNLNLQATSGQTAEELTQLIQGVVAILNLAGQDNPQIAELAKSVAVSKKRTNVSVHFEHDVNKIAKFIKVEWEKKQLKIEASTDQAK